MKNIFRDFDPKPGVDWGVSLVIGHEKARSRRALHSEWWGVNTFGRE
jgi:hypothetical protein